MTVSKSPVVSVIIPAFNRADTLSRAIDSCLTQTFKDFEVIVVDDGSNDHTALAVRSFSADPRVRLLQHATNLGAAKARNTGLYEARGRFLAFLDSDDEWLPRKLEEQLRHFQRHHDPETLVSYCLLLQHRGPSLYNVVPRRAKHGGESFSEYTFEHGGFISTIAIVLPLSLALRCPFDETLTQHQDYDFCMQLEQLGVSFECVPEPLAIWHDNERHNRVSTPATSAPSWIWYDKHKESLTAASRLFFLARNVGPASITARPGHILQLVLSALRYDGMLRADFARLFLYLVFGRMLVWRLKNGCLYVQRLVSRRPSALEVVLK